MGTVMITIQLPDVSDIFSKEVNISVAPNGTKWSELDLGEKRKKIGVYVIHHNGKIKYVGKTNGNKMSFGMRLRRHFQEKAAGDHTYPRLAALQTPPSIKVSLFDLTEIQSYISHDISEPNILELVPLFESALIVSLNPEFQR